MNSLFSTLSRSEADGSEYSVLLCHEDLCVHLGSIRKAI